MNSCKKCRSSIMVLIKLIITIHNIYVCMYVYKYSVDMLIYVTGFGKNRLIAGVRNWSYSPFSPAK